MKKSIFAAALLLCSAAFANAEIDTTENPFGASASNAVVEPAVMTAQPEQLEARRRGGSKRSRSSGKSASSSGNCGSFPRTCGQMTSCAQAQQALQCGNTRLDRDKDGVPCESICG